MFKDAEERRTVANVFYYLSKAPGLEGTGDGLVAGQLALDLATGVPELPLLELFTRTTDSFRREWLLPFVASAMTGEEGLLGEWAAEYLDRAMLLIQPALEAREQVRQQIQQAQNGAQQPLPLAPSASGIPPQVVG